MRKEPLLATLNLLGTVHILRETGGVLFCGRRLSDDANIWRLDRPLPMWFPSSSSICKSCLKAADPPIRERVSVLWTFDILLPEE